MKSLFVICFLVFLFSCISEPPASPKHEFQGRVESITNTPLQGVSVRLEPVESPSAGFTVTTDAMGAFSASLKPGNYLLKTSVPGYAETSTNIEVKKINEVMNITLRGAGSVRGKILSSQSGAGLSNAAISFYRTEGNEPEPMNNKLEFQLVTDEDDIYAQDGLPEGSFVAKVEKEGFFPRVSRKIDLTTEEEEVNPLITVEMPPSGALRIVLTWGSIPQDADGHFFGPTESGERFHVYYNDKNPVPEVSLDVDARTGFGPETITISKLIPGTYKYSIYNYDKHGLLDPLTVQKLVNSPTVVEVYDDTQKLAEFPVLDMGATVEYITGIELFTIEVTADNFSLNVLHKWRSGHDSEYSRIASKP
jgi:hypothetical protein